MTRGEIERIRSLWQVLRVQNRVGVALTADADPTLIEFLTSISGGTLETVLDLALLSLDQQQPVDPVESAWERYVKARSALDASYRRLQEAAERHRGRLDASFAALQAAWAERITLDSAGHAC